MDSQTIDIKYFIAILTRLFKRLNRHEVFGLSGELAYFFLLSLFPFLLFLITLVGYLPLSAEGILDFIEPYAPEQGMAFIEENVLYIINQENGQLLSIGILVTIWSASNGLNAIIRAFNRAYEVKESRSYLVSRGMSIILTFAMIFVIIISLLLPVFGKQIGSFLFSVLGLSEIFVVLWEAIRWLLSTVIICIVFTGLYFFAPNKKLKLSESYPGALFATVGWIVVSYLFSYYVSNFGNYSATYGSLGAVIILLIWFYLTGLIIIIGGEINAVIFKYHHRKSFH
ncbi:YihY/virulence factor BrkB family protein [Bacillus carboniphilus]|uniref:YihY/virulence factor BrkB family protein n=1 Tax=Bacillus carboniphilus TaxID=86663 RepID=A0ABY9JSY4_9BACI|nr:YihY/virulence factor BrkB family protein [Bacillus carboniphilus]WLR42502.1 YihY/virulence factor BrkB family protein [Bacillus carboniphilus]